MGPSEMDAAASTETPLWRFSLTVYASEAVQSECLILQDRFGVDVNLLLFSAFIGAVDGIALTQSDIQNVSEATQQWSEEIVQCLRQARRALKLASANETAHIKPAIEALRRQVKTAELEAERIEQIMLWIWSREHLMDRPRIACTDALKTNVRLLLLRYGTSTDGSNPNILVPKLLDRALHVAGSTG